MDALTGRLDELLGCAETHLTLSVCRSFVAPGDTAPWDTCETSADGNGQLWTLVETMTPGFPSGAAVDVVPCPPQLTAIMQVGVVRCAVAVIGDNGQFPAPEDISADAEQVHQDRFELLQAIQCCMVNDRADLQVQQWVPLGPSGGCVGGAWTLQVRIPRCGCPPEA